MISMQTFTSSKTLSFGAIGIHFVSQGLVFFFCISSWSFRAV